MTSSTSGLDLPPAARRAQPAPKGAVAPVRPAADQPPAGTADDRLVPGWLAGIARSRLAAPVMALLSLLDACISPVLPEVLLVPLCLANPARRWLYATWCATASVVGAGLGYGLGYVIATAGLLESAFTYIPGFTPELFAATSQRFGEQSFLWILAAAFTPLPFKVFTVAAGICHEQVSLTVLLLASVAGRFPRFALEVALIHRFGPGFLHAMRRPAFRIALVGATAAALLALLTP